MSATTIGRSCIRCHEAKRKCDRNVPACRLCRRRNLTCAYPPRKPSAFVPIPTTEEHCPMLDCSLIEFESPSNDLLIPELLPDLTLDAVRVTHLSSVTDPRAKWFTAPEAFLVDHAFVPLPPNFKVLDLKIFVQSVNNWMRDWVVTGSNTFIHAHLYEDYFPPCLQIAFTTFSAYINRTAATSEMVLRTVNDQATALLSTSNGNHLSNHVLEDLALVHALFAYQMIGLFDGDIRSRHLAESRTPVIAALLDCILAKASAALIDQDCINNSSLILLESVSPEARLWRSWVISESLRRTWIIARGVSAAYDGLKQGWAPCYGSVRTTAREGLWSASSVSLWTEMCIEQDVCFVGQVGMESLFELPPEDVDDFAKAILETQFGQERFVRWMSGS